MAKRWYSVSVLSNFEKKIAEQIRQSVAEQGLEEDIDEVLVPTEEVIEVRRGKKVQSERKFMPGYVLVNMDLNEDSWSVVKNTPGITGFVGASNEPVPLTADNLERCLIFCLAP